jgi:hypothetical protein
VGDEVGLAGFSAGYTCYDPDSLFLGNEYSFGLGRRPPK